MFSNICRFNNNNLIENNIDYKIELIYDNNQTYGGINSLVFIKANRKEQGIIKNNNTFSATNELVNLLT